MTESSNFNFKIGIIGPTRVGKTSLIASILQNSQKLLEGTPIKISPNGKATELRIAQHQKELDGSLRAGEFHPGAVQGTEEMFTFQLHLDPGVEGAGIDVNILDYPGGWLDSERRPPERENDWEDCKNWLEQSTVLLVPIESAIIMEAELSKYKKAVPHILTTFEVAQVVRAWAKGRASKPDEPALLMLCPVKCESYFADNGGLRDKSNDLLLKVRDVYHEVIEAAKGEFKNAGPVKILYVPIDTIGCVEIIEANWKQDVNAPGKYEFTADYLVRNPKRQSSRGADAVLISLCNILVEAKKNVLDQQAKIKREDANKSHDYAIKREGFFKDIWLWMSGERKSRQGIAKKNNENASRQEALVKMMEDTIAELSERKLGPRVHEL